jgi:hypothetical protein
MTLRPLARWLVASAVIGTTANPEAKLKSACPTTFTFSLNMTVSNVDSIPIPGLHSPFASLAHTPI